MNSTFSTEFQTLVSACIRLIEKENTGWKPGSEVDDRLTRLVNWHGVSSLLPTVAEDGPDKETPVLSESAKHGLDMTAELLWVYRAFSDAGIRAIPFRGPVWAEVLYGSLSRRYFSDLDFFLDPNSWQVAEQTLRALGYEPEITIPENTRPWFLTQETGLDFLRLREDQPRFRVEPHYQTSDCSLVQKLTLTDLEPFLETRTLWGQEFTLFDATGSAILLWIHHAGHENWGRLSYLLDNALLFKRFGGLVDWHQLEKKVKSVGIWDMGLAGCLVSESLFGLTILPDDLRMKISDQAKRASRQILHGLEEAPFAGQKRLRRLGFHLRYRDSFRFKTRVFFSHLKRVFFPTRLDFAWIQLPRPLLLLYFFVRPIRMIVSLFQRFVRR